MLAANPLGFGFCLLFHFTLTLCVGVLIFCDGSFLLIDSLLDPYGPIAQRLLASSFVQRVESCSVPFDVDVGVLAYDLLHRQKTPP